MTRIAAIKDTTSQETTKQQKTSAAKRAFILGLLDVSWKLAAALLMPLAIGLYLEKPGSQTYTTIGLFVGILFAVLVIIQLARNSGSQK